VCRYHFTTSAATHTTQQGGVPAVTFTYDLSPMQVIIAEESEGLFRFVVYVFAIIGGGFTVFGMIDGLVYHSDRLLREKVGLGKAA
jgi:endoplasmic reticulum-Golgi intermediate compartment protein 3